MQAEKVQGNAPTAPQGPSGLVMFSMLDLSTAHVSSMTRELMVNDAAGALLYPKADYGWFVHVPALADGAVDADECPADLAACLRFAQASGAHWIMFDRDADEVADLAVYDDAAMVEGV